MKVRSDSALAQLTEDQRDQIFDWLSTSSYADVIDRCAQPPPEGFTISFHKTTLVRFYSKERARRHAEQWAETRASARTAVEDAHLLEAARLELAHACFENAQGFAAPRELNALSRIVNRLETLKLERERLDLERQRHQEQIRQWEFNAARHLMKHYAQLGEIDKTPGQDDEQKIWQARELAFGPTPRDKSIQGVSANALPANGPSAVCGQSGESVA